MGRALVERILRRLDQAGWGETNPHLQDDYRIAALTVFFAFRGYRDPHVSACYVVIGVHPDKFLSALDARRRALLGPEYESFFAEQPPLEEALRAWSPRKLPPKKPPQSVRNAGEDVGRGDGVGVAGKNKRRKGLIPAPFGTTCATDKRNISQFGARG